MPEVPPQLLEQVLARVRRDFGARQGIHAVQISRAGGRPVIFIQGTSPARPEWLPKAFRAQLANGGTLTIPIEWQHAAHTANRQMWGGGVRVTNKFPRLIESSQQSLPLENKGQPIPPPVEGEYQFSLTARRPSFVVPDYWAQPLELMGTVCVPFYNTWVTAVTYTVPSMYMAVIQTVSYEFNNCLNLMDQFQVQVQETVGRQAQWTDMLASTNPDPAYQFAFAGHVNPIPMYMIVDHDQTVTAQFQVLGQYPFTNTRSTKLGGCGTIYLHGFMSKLMDTRDGGARPSDMGRLNDLILNDTANNEDRI